MSFATERVLILGGTGFIGSVLAQALSARGYGVTIPTRHRQSGQHLLVLPTCEVVEANVYDKPTLTKLVAEHDIVVNLIGILHGDFERVHVALPKTVATLCAAHKVQRLIHMSALGADEAGPSAYQRSRGRGEAAVLAVAAAHPALGVTVFRPSVVFGARDKFINMFAALAALFPVIPLGSASATFQPVWVDDVVRAIVTALESPATINKNYALVGPRVYSLRGLVEFAASISGKRPWIVGLGPALSMLQATIFQYLPGKLITPDNVYSMRVPNVSATPFPAIFGAPQSLESVFRGEPKHDNFQPLRQSAGRVPTLRR